MYLDDAYRQQNASIRRVLLAAFIHIANATNHIRALANPFGVKSSLASSAGGHLHYTGLGLVARVRWVHSRTPFRGGWGLISGSVANTQREWFPSDDAGR